MQIDSTNMESIADNEYDITMDKGTYDALACTEGGDKSMIRDLLTEMVRVSKHAVIIITNGTPEKRLNDFNQFCKDKG